MNQDCLKLTTYFGERQRVDGRLLADELLDLYGRERVATSIVLRGVEGFGLKHHLRTDTSLTLSEDLPAVAIAVDTRDRIQPLADQVAAMPHSSLITLERARLHSGELTRVELPERLHEATKLTIYIGRQERVYGVPAHVAVCELLHRRGIAGATTLLGVDGTAHGRRQRARFLGRNADVPLMVIAVGSGSQIVQVLPQLDGLLSHPMVTFERVHVCKRDGVVLGPPPTLPAEDAHGMALWQKLVIYTSEAQLHDGRPAHREITRRLREAGASGSTTLRGTWGFHGDHAPHGDRVFRIGRHVPVVTSLVDTPANISAWFDIVDEITAEGGLVSSEIVPAARVNSGEHGRGDLRLSSHDH